MSVFMYTYTLTIATRSTMRVFSNLCHHGTIPLLISNSIVIVKLLVAPGGAYLQSYRHIHTYPLKL